MRMQYFKNPADGSESDELDDLVDEVDELGMPMVVVPMPIDFEDDVRSILNSDNDIETDNSDESDFDPYAADSDDSMSDVEAENSGADTNADEAGPSGSAGRDTKGGSGEAGGSADGRGSGEGRSSVSVGGGGGEGAADSDDDSDDDETVRKIKENIKKPRNAPPQIQLEEFIMDICMHSERNIIAIATISGDVLLYQYTNEGNTLLRTVEAHAKACRDVEFSYDGNDLITCSKDKSIMIHDVETEKLKKFYETAHDEPIDQLYVMDEFMLASGDEGGTVKLWDLRTKEPVFALHEVDDYITKIISNNAKKLLLFTSGDGYLTTVNIGARKLYVQSEPYEEELTCMELYRGDSKLVVGTSQGRLYSYNWGQFGYHCDMYPGIKTPIETMVPLTDRSCVVAGEEGIIRACHIAPYRNLGIVGQHDSHIEALDIDSTGEILASASHNYEVRFWNVKYFEDFDLVKNHEKHNAYNDKRHNLPSSKFSNATDFFSDLAGEPNQEGEN